MDEAFTGIHVTREKTNIFTDIPTRDAFAHQWAYFAKRYKAIRSEKLSFNLVNEPLNLNGPAEITELTNAGKSADDAHTEVAARFAQQYGEVARLAIDAIRKQDPDRLIVTDGLQAGNAIIPGLFDSRVLQSCHTYTPMPVTHYQCEWARSKAFGDSQPEPTWPLKNVKGKIVAGSRDAYAHV
jgi:endoglucanase